VVTWIGPGTTTHGARGWVVAVEDSDCTRSTPATVKDVGIDGRFDS